MVASAQGFCSVRPGARQRVTQRQRGLGEWVTRRTAESGRASLGLAVGQDFPRAGPHVCPASPHPCEVVVLH